FPTTVVVNDLFAFFRKASPNTGTVKFAPEVNTIVRNVAGSGLDQSIPVPILTGATAEFTAGLMGAATYPAAGTLINDIPMGDLLASGTGQKVVGKPTVSGTGTTTTVIKIPTATHEYFPIGCAILVENANPNVDIKDEVRWVVGKDDGGGSADTLYIKPALTNAPADGSRICPLVTFGLVELGHPRITLVVFQPDDATSGQRVVIYNAITNFDLGQEVSNLLDVNFKFTAGNIFAGTLDVNHFSRFISDSEIDEEPSWGPIPTLRGQIAFRVQPAGSGTGTTYSATLRDITKFQGASGNTIASKKSMNTTTGVKSTSITKRQATLSLSAYLEGAFPDFGDMLSVSVKDVQIQLGGDKFADSGGAAIGSIFVGRWPNAVISSWSRGGQDGLITVELPMNAAKDLGQSFEDPDLGTVTHNSPLIQDSYRLGVI
ncbi:MAG TPA: hypothetical protein VF382_07350, partial [Actinomycetota bacterium]